MQDLAAFQKCADVIVANRVTDDIRDVQNKVFTRDLSDADLSSNLAEGRLIRQTAKI
jgi:hypothetical protein